MSESKVDICILQRHLINGRYVECINYKKFCNECKFYDRYEKSIVSVRQLLKEVIEKECTIDNALMEIRRTIEEILRDNRKMEKMLG